MARRTITIEEKIEKQSQEVWKAKKRYEDELDELNRLIEQKKAEEVETLIQAYQKSGKSFDEIMDFLNSK